MIRYNTSEDLEKGIQDTLSKQIEEQINKEVMFSLLLKDGWIEVVISRYTDNHHAIDISEWLDENVRGNYMREGGRFIFQLEKDANWFKLKWL